MRRVLLAAICATVLLGADAGLAAACLFVPRTLGEEASLTQFIFIARVVRSPEPGAAVLATTQVFRGSVPATLRFPGYLGPGAVDCLADPEVGSTYLFGANDLDGPLGLGSVWAEIDGNRVLPLAITVPTRNLAELLAVLNGLPDTSAAQAHSGTGPPRLPLVPAGVLLLTAAAAVVMRGRRPSFSEPS